MDKKSQKITSLQEDYAKSKHNFKQDKSYLSYNDEMYFYDLVKQGNVEQLEALKPQIIVNGQGILSDNKIRNIKYHFCIGTALIARFCIEGGMSKDSAYTMSDVFIRKMDTLSYKEDIEKLYHEVVIAYANAMRELKKTSGSSFYIRKAIEYITSHYQEQIQVNNISEYLGLSEKYLSTLFKKETGQTIISYIEKIKIEEACCLLTYTDFSCEEIAESLSFNTHSYFTKIFKKNTGMTPMQYRLKNKNNPFTVKK